MRTANPILRPKRVGTGLAPVRERVHATDLRTGASPVPTRFICIISLFEIISIINDGTRFDMCAKK